MFMLTPGFRSEWQFFKKIDLSNEAPGSFKVKYANFSDQANNSIWYSDDSGDADGQKPKFLNAGFDFDQWAFTLKNGFDNTPPQGVISMPVQLEDGVLNISDGETALLNYQASFNDGTGSGFDYFSVELTMSILVKRFILVLVITT